MRFLQRPALGACFSPADRITLDSIVTRLDAVMASLSGSSFFVRLCGRSPKDGEPLDQAGLKERYDRVLASLGERGFDTKDGNTQTMAIAFLNHLKVENGREALNLLLTSERVYIDLIDALRCGEFEGLVVRKWMPEMSYDREFRAFVYDGKLTGITQYDHYCCYPWLHTEKEALEERLVKFCETELQPRMRDIPHYIADVADLPGKGVMLIELSPFLRCTGAALFRWKMHKEQLMNGPFEFRLRSEPYPGLVDLLESGWFAKFSEPVPPYWEYFPDEGWLGPIKNWLSWWWAPREEKAYVFVYGLLQRGGFYHDKFLGASRFVGKGRTVQKMKMFVDRNGAPQLVEGVGEGNRVNGEVLEIPRELLDFFGRYKFVRSGFYTIEKLAIQLQGSTSAIEAACIVRRRESVQEDLSAMKLIHQYRLMTKKRRFNPVMDMADKVTHYIHRSVMTMN